jgi:multimeric flavodoxin WrbA
MQAAATNNDDPQFPVLRILGVSGSPREAATSILVQAALLGAASVDDADTEYVSLAGKRIEPCNGCAPCNAAGHCLIDDDMQPMYARLLAADVVIVGSPVYYGAPSALCKAFMERVQGLGIKEKKLRMKIGGAIATGGSRNGGQESTLASIHLWFHILEMIPIGITAPVTQWGATGNAGYEVEAIHDDVVPLKLAGTTVKSTQIAWMYGRKLATVARIVAAGRAATGLDLPDSPYGFAMPESFPAELDALTGTT